MFPATAAAERKVVLPIQVAKALVLEKGQAEEGLLQLAFPGQVVGLVLDGVPLLPPGLVRAALLALVDAIEELVQGELAGLVLELQNVRDEARVQLGVAVICAE